MQKIFKLSDFAILILFVLFGSIIISSSKDHRKIDKNNLPFFVIQQGKLSKQQIADLTKFSDAKNIWVINDDENYKKTTELIKQSADAISYANQIGRLDLVSMFLAVIALIFGLAGIIGFLHIETMVKAQIDQTIKKEFEEGGLGNETVREEAKKSFDKMSSRPIDPSLGEEGDGDDEAEAEAHYEELFKKIRDEI